jgi:hypothetical protein
MGYEFIEDSRIGIIAYDISIKNIDERKKKAITYKTIKLATQRLGIGNNVIKNAAEKRLRVYSPNLDKELAIRYHKDEKRRINSKKL